MGIFKKANNIYITVRDTYTSISGSSYEEAEEVIIEATNGDLEFVSSNKVIMQGLGNGKGDDKNKKTQLLIVKVEGKDSAKPYEKVTYKVTKYNQDKVSENDKKRIQWAMKIDGEKQLLKEKGDTLELTIKEEWAAKEIIVMPFLINPDKEKVSKIVKISDTMNYIVVPEKGIIKKDFSKKPQMEKYKINGRNSSEITIKKLLKQEKFDNTAVEAGIKKIIDDYNGKYNSNFPDDYYVIFGKFLFKINYSQYVKVKDTPKYLAIAYALSESCKLVDGDEGFLNGLGAPLFHIYENVVRRNNDTGLDKLLHFLYSAYYSYVNGPTKSTILGIMKEFFKDEVNSWFNDKEKGWDDKDMEANKRGVDFGMELTIKILNNETI